MQGYTGQGQPNIGEGHIALLPSLYSYVTQGAWIAAYSTAYPTFTLLYNASTAQNDQIDYYVWLSKGTYTFSQYGMTNTVNAILTLLLDGVSVGTIDQYAGSEVYGVLGTITGIAVTTSGRHILSFKAATKNGSSGGWTLGIHTFAMWRTA